MLRVALLLITILVALLSGCNATHSPVYSGDPPVEVIPAGPGKISGTLVIKAPALYIEGKATPVMLRYGGSIGVYKDGAYLPTRNVWPTGYSRVSTSDPYLWQTEFSFEDLPLGEYVIKLARIDNPDWDIYDVNEYYASEPVVLTKEQPVAAVGKLEHTDNAWGPEGEISGDLLLHGLDTDRAWFSLDRDFFDYDYDIDYSSQADWQANLRPRDHGRVGYRITGLNLRRHYVNGSAGSSWRLGDGGVRHPEGIIELTAAEPVSGGYDILQHTHDPDAPWSTVTLSVDAPATWAGYLLLESRRTDGRAGRYDTYRYLLSAQDENKVYTDWIGGLSPDGQHIFSLYHLEPGGAATLIKEYDPLEFEEYVVEQTDPPSLFLYEGTYYRANLAVTIDQVP